METDHNFLTPIVEKAEAVDFEGASSDEAGCSAEAGPADTAAAAAILSDPVAALPEVALAKFPADAVFRTLAPQVLKHFGLDIGKEKLQYHVSGLMTPQAVSTVTTTTTTATTESTTASPPAAPSPNFMPAPSPPPGAPTVADAVGAAEAETKHATLEVAGGGVRSVRAYVCLRAGQKAGSFLTFSGARSLLSRENSSRATVRVVIANSHHDVI